MIGERIDSREDWMHRLEAKMVEISQRGGESDLYHYLRVDNPLGIPPINRMLDRKFPYSHDDASTWIKGYAYRIMGRSDVQVDVHDRRRERVVVKITTAPNGIILTETSKVSSYHGRIDAYELSYRLARPQ